MRNHIKSPFNELINIYEILEQVYNLNDAITLTKQELSFISRIIYIPCIPPTRLSACINTHYCATCI